MRSSIDVSAHPAFLIGSSGLSKSGRHHPFLHGLGNLLDQGPALKRFVRSRDPMIRETLSWFDCQQDNTGTDLCFQLINNSLNCFRSFVHFGRDNFIPDLPDGRKKIQIS